MERYDSALEQLTKRDISDVVADASVRSCDFHWRLAMGEQNLRCRVRGSSTFSQLLHENFAQHDVVVVFENRTKHNRYTICLGLHIQSLLITIIDDSSLLAFQTLLLERKVLLEQARKAVTLEHANLASNLLIVVGNVLEIDEHRHVEAILGLDE
jgi:hypothetical protein